ncbi:MAG: transcriptional regulator [Rhizobiaceae bacterium]|nr:transcriptional regulator [Rhizobiaceae bacterium]
MADDSEPTIFIIIGRVWETAGEEPLPVHVMLAAPDEDSAVRKTLESLADEGFVEAELDQIGLIDEEPEEEPHISAYQGALEGEVAIIRFAG